MAQAYQGDTFESAAFEAASPKELTVTGELSGFGSYSTLESGFGAFEQGVFEATTFQVAAPRTNVAEVTSLTGALTGVGAEAVLSSHKTAAVSGETSGVNSASTLSSTPHKTLTITGASSGVGSDASMHAGLARVNVTGDLAGLGSDASISDVTVRVTGVTGDLAGLIGAADMNAGPYTQPAAQPPVQTGGRSPGISGRYGRGRTSYDSRGTATIRDGEELRIEARARGELAGFESGAELRAPQRDVGRAKLQPEPSYDTGGGLGEEPYWIPPKGWSPTPEDTEAVELEEIEACIAAIREAYW